MRPRSRQPLATFAVALLSFLVAGCSGDGLRMDGPCTLPPASDLTAVETYPVNEATGVSVGATLRVRFNTCVDESTLTAQSVLLSNSGTLVPGSIGYEAATATVLFDPTADLEYASAYALAVGLLRGAHGEKQNQAVGVFFETQSTPEFVPPVTTATPPGSRYNTPQSVALSCVDNTGGTGCAGTFYTLDGSAPSPASTRYTNPISITADTTLRFFSVDGQGNVEATKQEQYTIDTVPPTLAGSVPANGATGVPLTQTITVTFSEDMAPATLNASTVSIDQGVTATLSYDASTHTLTLQPTERLACRTTYQVAVSAGATDIATNPLTQPATFSFTTITDCDEPITTASVASGVYLTARSVTLTCSDVGSGCARIRYTTDGTVPSETNGTTVSAATAGPISIGAGDTRLRFFSEDNAGNREVLRERAYTVSIGSGFTFVGTGDGLARGVGPTPSNFVSLRPPGPSEVFFRDATNNRLYKGDRAGLVRLRRRRGLDRADQRDGQHRLHLLARCRLHLRARQQGADGDRRRRALRVHRRRRHLHGARRGRVQLRAAHPQHGHQPGHHRLRNQRVPGFRERPVGVEQRRQQRELQLEGGRAGAGQHQPLGRRGRWQRRGAGLLQHQWHRLLHAVRAARKILFDAGCAEVRTQVASSGCGKSSHRDSSRVGLRTRTGSSSRHRPRSRTKSGPPPRIGDP